MHSKFIDNISISKGIFESQSCGCCMLDFLEGREGGGRENVW